jgi:hypothetical protein
MSDHSSKVDSGPAQQAPETERRGAPRFPSDQEVLCRPAITGADTALMVQVKDVSESGLGLLTEKRFEPGTVVVLWLDAAAPRPVYVLARVVRVAPRSGRMWDVGCVFFGELSAEELDAFRAARTTPDKAERRAWVRPSPNVLAVSCRDAAGRLGQAAAEIWDLSPASIGLLVPSAVEVGTHLKIDLPPLDEQPPRTAVVRVVKREDWTDGRWLLDCAISASE